MASLEMRGGGGSGGGGGGLDPSNIHLKKEFTQIRKASRVLRDPGTSSTWRSPPLNSARSLTKHHYMHSHKNGLIDGNAIASSSKQFSQLESNNNNNNGIAVSNNGNVNVKEKDKRVFLYNWKSQKSESERSRQIGEEEEVENGKDEGSSSTPEESVDLDSLSDARNNGGNDSKSDTYLTDKYASAIFRCKDTNFTPSIRRTIKKKSKRSNYLSASLKHHNHRLQKQMLLSRCRKYVVERDDVDQSDDTEDYCNSEDVRRASAISPLLARLKNKAAWGSCRKDDDSVTYSTPALSTSSYNNKYRVRNPSTVESWDGATGSFNDADDEIDDDDDQLDLPGRHGCGIPCYWSKRSTPKSGVGYGSSILCGSNRAMHQRRHSQTSLASSKRRFDSRAVAQSRVPLLTNTRNRGSSMGSDDELSTNYGELDLEALSRLDGRRWSTSCRSQEGLELVALNEEVREEEGSPENSRSLSHKYRPMFFEELIGQNLVVQSLMSAVSRGRVSPVYLFQGPRGTGKTSTARIFAAALNCLATEETKPCGVCKECSDFVSRKSRYLREVDGSDKKGIDKIKYLLKNHLVARPSALPDYTVFVIDECHLLPTKTWLTFIPLIEKPLPRVIFILVTTDIDNVPRAILSRCQKNVFNKISSGDIVIRLRKIVSDEKLDVELDALELIASNADGSLRDAETMLDQLTLFGKRITVSLVNELIGVVSDEKLLELLELAMSSNATETVIRARELMDSGIDPIVLMSQMASLIVDIIAGNYPSNDPEHNDSFFGGRISERELDRLKHALKLLSEAEKHLRVSSERSTWFTATLLQLGSVPSPDRTQSGSSRRQSSKATEDDHISREAIVQNCNSTSKENPVGSNPNPSHSEILLGIWLECIDKCHSKTLRQLLQSYGKLVSISETKGGFVAHIGFGDNNIKTRAEGFLSSITNSFEIVLRRNVEVEIILLRQNPTNINTTMNLENRSTRLNVTGHQTEPSEFVSGNANTSTSKENKANIPPVRRIESIIHEQRLESAWLQAMEKGTPGSISRLKPERNQVLPQNELESRNCLEAPLQHWEDELNREIKALKISDGMATQKEQIINNHCPISPSLLHNTSFASNFSKDNLGYESGPGAAGCSGMFCWNNTRPQRRTRKAKHGTPIRARKSGRFSWFGECAKSRRADSRYNR
ncbi:hypothetical protein RD792_015955 [Penstemon davidsonii]|uniref:AAA+ ATPase domain-containing protein n=1 Tax=Penstemon davidsonii TaxID=160366 RepID=A0ABR0CIQ5_9LAMI|nr:hypothetical protein RD792_015955 [Penstemon davidsonii]